MLDYKAMLDNSAVEAETVGQTSAENKLGRALGSPNGRHQRSANAHDAPTQKAKIGPDPTIEALDITGA